MKTTLRPARPHTKKRAAYAASVARMAAPVATASKSAPRVRHGIPASVRPGRTEREAAMLVRGDAPPAILDDLALRLLGTEILKVAVDDARCAKARDFHGPREVRQEARAFIAGPALDWCIEVFGLRLDADAVRRALHTPKPALGRRKPCVSA